MPRHKVMNINIGNLGVREMVEKWRERGKEGDRDRKTQRDRQTEKESHIST